VRSAAPPRFSLKILGFISCEILKTAIARVPSLAKSLNAIKGWRRIGLESTRLCMRYSFSILLWVGLNLLSSLPAHAVTVRIATFNAYLNRPAQGQLIRDLSTPDDGQAQAVAEIIQRVRPDILVLQEFDFDPTGEAMTLFQQQYLGRSHQGTRPIEYPYVYIPTTNTGLPSGYDLDNSGTISRIAGSRDYGGDGFGFGTFPGQYGMVVLSRYPIDQDNIRSFQQFLWRDMPGALLPTNPATQEPWFSPETLEVVRLSSKNHVDVPIEVNGQTLHILASHPTPPVFDGPEDRNGRRNHDEIRLWADYITPEAGSYLYDDQGGQGSFSGTHFVILGDQNADPQDGDAYPGAIAQLLNHPRINASFAPESEGGRLLGANDPHQNPPAQDTAVARIGGLRLDYVLPSRSLSVVGAGVFWPAPTDPLWRLVGDGDPVISSDHRLVWIDVNLPE